ncbi:hypothetical protein, partial [Escherichia coli]|uniref:hypothetical protein n=2 Tax=Escherichia coli TaxID=562 RepID=UPI00105904F4
MSKKFTKTILSSAVAGLLLVSGGVVAANPKDVNIGGEYIVKFYNDGEGAEIVKAKGKKEVLLGAINTTTGSIMTFNEKEAAKSKTQDDFNSIVYPVYLPELKLENIKSLNVDDIKKIQEIKKNVSEVVTSANSAEYLSAIRSGGNTEAYLAINKTSPALSKEYSRISGNIEQLNKDTTFAIDADGNITLDETVGTGERYGVKDVVADLVADTTVYAEEDGSLTMDNSAPARKRVNEALVDLDKSVRERTTVGVSSDGTLTRAEGAKNTISVNDGLVALSGRTDRIDAAVGAIDGRVTRNTQSI